MPETGNGTVRYTCWPWESWAMFWRWRELEVGVGLKCFVKERNIFLVLAGSTAEIQTRLHQPFPGQSARAGAKGTREEGPAVACCSHAEESPQRPIHFSERYCASSHSHLSHPLYYSLSLCSCSGCLPPNKITNIEIQNTEQGSSCQPICVVF